MRSAGMRGPKKSNKKKKKKKRKQYRDSRPRLAACTSTCNRPLSFIHLSIHPFTKDKTNIRSHKHPRTKPLQADLSQARNPISRSTTVRRQKKKNNQCPSIPNNDHHNNNNLNTHHHPQTPHQLEISLQHLPFPSESLHLQYPPQSLNNPTNYTSNPSTTTTTILATYLPPKHHS